MPLVNSDFGQLEWRTIVELSGDKTALEEILNDLDFHSDNKKRFNLPSRLIAKVFLFRWIYRGSAYAYSKDPDFAPIGNEKFWQQIIDEFNNKYIGVYNWHEKVIGEAVKFGVVTNPITGREYDIEPKMTRNGPKWHEPDIVNFPNQGFGADIAALVRIMEYEKIVARGMQDLILPVLTVHDSLLNDCAWEKRAWYECMDIRDEVITQLPDRFELEYGYRLQVPHKLEHEVGVRYGWMHSLG